MRNLINNKRGWNAAIELCKVLNELRKENDLESDYAALKHWAEKASYEKWDQDAVGQILGVGLTTYQYLRLQVGVDTIVPDRMIRREAKDRFNVTAMDQVEFIKKMEDFLSKTEFSSSLFCWAVWLQNST